MAGVYRIFCSCCMGSGRLNRQVVFNRCYVVFLCSLKLHFVVNQSGCMCEVKGLGWPFFCRSVSVFSCFFS